MSSEQKSSAASTWAKVVIGVALAVGGTWFSYNVHLPFVDKLAEQGIPLDLGKTIAVIGAFIALMPAIKSFFTGPLGEAIMQRTTELERTFTEAETLRAEMTKMRNEYEQRIVSTEAAAREQIQAQIKEAQNLRQTLMAEAASKADELVRRAQQDIEAEKHKVMTELRLQVVNLTLTATERLLGENMDTDKNRRLVQEFVDKAEVSA